MPHATPITPNDASKIEIVFEISGGIGGVEQSWIIRGDGSVQDQAGKTYAVPAIEVAQLLSEVTAAGFFDLAAAYEDIACADCFAYSISVNDGQRIKRVRMLDGGQLPEQAQQVIRLLRAFVSAFAP